MQTYIINLDSATDRWRRVQAMMAPTGMSYQRVSAVVGRELTLPIPEFSKIGYRAFHGKYPDLGQIGCYLSHIKTLRLFLDSDSEFAVICEDDITPVPQLSQLVHRAIDYSQYWDLVRLTGVHDGRPMRVCQLTPDYSLAINRYRLSGTGGYMVNRHAARTLVRRLLPMTVPIDHAIDREWFYGLRAMAIDPLPATQISKDLVTSIPPALDEKTPKWQRYWTVFPYRGVNEASRFVMRTWHYLRASIRVRLARPIAHTATENYSKAG